MRFKFDKKKSEELRKNPKRNIGFEEAQEICGIRTTRTFDPIRQSSSER